MVHACPLFEMKSKRKKVPSKFFPGIIVDLDRDMKKVFLKRERSNENP